MSGARSVAEEKLMARQLTNELFAQEVQRSGAFGAILNLTKEGTMSEDVAVRMIKKAFKNFLEQVREAQKEVRRLDAVLARLAPICDAGVHQNLSPKSPAFANKVRELAHEVTTLDNWVVSLYETDLSMMWLGNPDRAAAKPIEFANSMAVLRQKRMTEMSAVLKDPSLFHRG